MPYDEIINLLIFDHDLSLRAIINGGIGTDPAIPFLNVIKLKNILCITVIDSIACFAEFGSSLASVSFGTDFPSNSTIHIINTAKMATTILTMRCGVAGRASKPNAPNVSYAKAVTS